MRAFTNIHNPYIRYEF